MLISITQINTTSKIIIIDRYLFNFDKYYLYIIGRFLRMDYLY